MIFSKITKNAATTLKNWFISSRQTLGPTTPKRTWEFDYLLLLTVVALLLFGLIMVYSSSFIYAKEKTGNGFSFIRKQFLYSILGMVLLWRVSLIPVYRWFNWAYPILGLSFLLVLMTFIPGIGLKAGGAKRWIHLFGFNGQPAEFAKFSILFFMAKQLYKKREGKKNLHLFAPLPILLLLLLQPDFGTVAIVCCVIGILFFLTGVSWKFLVTLFGSGSLALFLLMVSSAYRRNRILAFLDPWQDPGGKGFQVIQSFVGLHHGRFFGVGLGNGKEKLFYLPEAHNDFIFSVVGEELGFLGVTGVALTYLFFIYRGLKIASDSYLRNQNSFSFLLAVSITLALGLQGFMNMSVVLGLVPTKGLTLPFVSYGGSALLVDLFAIGVLLSVSRIARVSIRKE